MSKPLPHLYIRQERRLEEHFDPNTIGRCPTPLKKVYVTTVKAQEFISEHYPTDSVIEPYKCYCGAIHIGHSSPHYQKE